MKGVLVIAHGSRAKETEVALKEIMDIVTENLTAITDITDIYIEHAFMQFGDKTIASGISALAEKKVTEIKIVPYFLFTGIHMKEDIPNQIGEIMKNYPDIKIVMGEPIGNDKQRLAEILVDKITR